MQAAEHHAIGLEQPGLTDLACFGPSRRAVRGYPLGLPRTPDGHCDRNHDRRDPAGRRDVRTLDEDVAGIGVVGEPPPEKGRRLAEGPAQAYEPGIAKLRLKAQLPCGPFRRRPEEGEHDGADEEHLAPEDLRR